MQSLSFPGILVQGLAQLCSSFLQGTYSLPLPMLLVPSTYCYYLTHRTRTLWGKRLELDDKTCRISNSFVAQPSLHLALWVTNTVALREDFLFLGLPCIAHLQMLLGGVLNRSLQISASPRSQQARIKEVMVKTNHVLCRCQYCCLKWDLALWPRLAPKSRFLCLSFSGVSKMPPCLTQEVTMSGGMSPHENAGPWMQGWKVLKSKVWESVVLKYRLRRQMSQFRKRLMSHPSICFNWALDRLSDSCLCWWKSVTDSKANRKQRPSATSRHNVCLLFGHSLGQSRWHITLIIMGAGEAQQLRVLAAPAEEFCSRDQWQVVLSHL